MISQDLNIPASPANKPTISRRLLSFARPYWKEITLSLSLSVATTAANIGLMGTSAWLIATAALQPSIAELQVAIVGVRAFGIARGVFRYLERLVSHSVNFHLLARLRGWFFRSVEPLVPGAIEDIKAGDLLARSARDIEALEDFYVRGIAPPLAAIVVTLGISLFTLQFGVSLAALLACGLLLTGFVLSFLIRRISHGQSQILAASRGHLAAVSMETIRNTGEILMSGARDSHLGRVRRASNDVRDAGLSVSRLHSISLAAGVLISNLTLAAILTMGIHLVQTGQIDGVTLAVLALVTLAGFEPVNLLPAASARVETSLASAGRLFEVADRPLPVIDMVNASSLSEFHRLSINSLEFSYPAVEHPALTGINLELHPGSKIALVGQSGCGKTTLLKIIQHHLSPSSGTVTWNDINSSELDGKSIRSMLSVISQDGYLFSASIRENLRLTSPQSDDSEMTDVMQKVGLSNWFNNLPEGLDTWLGDNGKLLSGGERQRLIIARALLMNRPVILADEPLVGLDSESDKELLSTLLHQSSGTACIIATHRLVGMEEFDEILVLASGRIIQRGKHSDLSSGSGLYRQILDQQNNRFSFN